MAKNQETVDSMKQYFIYIMTNKPRGTLYIGVTSNLVKRVFEHRSAIVDGFTKKYRLHSLVYYEEFREVQSALQRERNLKHWLRNWKIELIEKQNPNWIDLWGEMAG